jgi:hypothetical protein
MNSTAKLCQTQSPIFFCIFVIVLFIEREKNYATACNRLQSVIVKFIYLYSKNDLIRSTKFGGVNSFLKLFRWQVVMRCAAAAWWLFLFWWNLRWQLPHPAPLYWRPWNHTAITENKLNCSDGIKVQKYFIKKWRQAVKKLADFYLEY